MPAWSSKRSARSIISFGATFLALPNVLLPSLPRIVGAFLVPMPLVSSSAKSPVHAQSSPKLNNLPGHNIYRENTSLLQAMADEAQTVAGDDAIISTSLPSQEVEMVDSGAPVDMVKSTPLWNAPNILTLMRVAAIPVFACVFYAAIPRRNIWCSVIFALAAVTDWLDGFIARRQGIATPFGAFLDPVADKLMVSTALILLSERLGPWMAACTAIILCREIGVSALREWMAQLGLRETVKVGSAGKWKTATQMVALTMLLLLEPGAKLTIVNPVQFMPVAKGLLVASTVLTVTSGSGYLKAAWPALMGRAKATGSS